MMAIGRSKLALALTLGLVPTANAQVVNLVADLYPPGNANPRGLVAYGDSLFVITDEIPFSTIQRMQLTLISKDLETIQTISSDLVIDEPTLVGDRLFWAESFGPDLDLAVYDIPTDDKEYLATTDVENPSQLTALDDLLFFSGHDAATGRELWISDGTDTGTVIVDDIHPTGSSMPGQITPRIGRVLFVADDGTHGRELWRSDGTAADTYMIRDIVAGPGSPEIQELAYVGGLTLFSATTLLEGRELWISDGTDVGTELLADINPGAGDSSPRDFVELDGFVYFSANDGSNGRELWITDGTTLGTQLVADIAPGAASSAPTELHARESALAFQATDGTSGREPWRSDGTSPGTQRIADIRPGPQGSSPTGFVDFDGVMYFAADDGFDGEELWRSTGTPAGTERVADIHDGGGSSSPRELTPIGSALFFASTDRHHGRELWRSNGSVGDAELAWDAWIQGSYPGELLEIGGTLFFTANDSAHGVELWTSDGTPAGTELVADLVPGITSSIPHELTDFAGELVFVASDGTGGEILYRSDGSAAGTTPIALFPDAVYPNPRLEKLTVSGGTLYFSFDDDVTGRELWQSDGTSGGTVLVADINPGPGSSYPDDLYDANGVLAFTADDGTIGYEPYKCSAGVVTLIEEINPGPDDCRCGAFTLVGLPVLGDQVFFTADDGVHGSELWRTNGTPAGTFMVADLRAGSTGSSPGDLVAGDDYVYFRAAEDSVGSELWRANGGGIELAADTWPGPDSGIASDLMFHDGLVYFASRDASGDTEPWVSDGTPSGTHQLADLNATIGSHPEMFHAHAGLVYFSAAMTDIFDRELYVTDGVTASLAWDVYRGPEGATPAGFQSVGSYLLFSASTDSTGRELFALDPAAVGVEDAAPPSTLVELRTAPNPTRRGATIRFSLPEPGPARVRIYDVRGRLVRVLQNAHLAAGAHTLAWDGRSGRSHRVASGVYFVRLEAPEVSAGRRIVVLD